MCFKYLFNCKYTAFENVNPSNFLKKITLYTIVNIYYNNLNAALDRFTETCNHIYKDMNKYELFHTHFPTII